MMRAIQKCTFLLNLSHCVKSYWHLCQIYQNHSPNIVMSHDPDFKFRNFLFFAQFCIKILGTVTKFGRNWLKNRKVTGKKQIGGWKTPPPPPPPPPPSVLKGLKNANLKMILQLSKVITNFVLKRSRYLSKVIYIDVLNCQVDLSVAISLNYSRYRLSVYRFGYARQ